MSDYTYPLGNAVKQARGRLGLTQNEVAEAIGIDSRTILNIENYKGNPKMAVLYPLLRFLHIDAREVFNPETKRDSPAIKQLRLVIEEFSEEDAEALSPVIKMLMRKCTTGQRQFLNQSEQSKHWSRP